MQRFVSVLSVLFVVSGIPIVHADTDSDSKKAPDRNYNLDDGSSRKEIELAQPYVLNVKNYSLTPDIFQKIAVKAFLKYRWKIEANEVTRLQGSYVKRSETYKTEIRFTGDTVVIGFVPGFHDSDRKWLRSLANAIKNEASLHRREAEAQRYLK